MNEVKCMHDGIMAAICTDFTAGAVLTDTDIRLVRILQLSDLGHHITSTYSIFSVGLSPVYCRLGTRQQINRLDSVTKPWRDTVLL